MRKIREDGSLPAYIFWLPAKTQRVLHLLKAIHWRFNQSFFKRLNKFLINERSFKSHQDQPWLFARQLQATRGRISTNLSLQKQQLLTGNSVVFPLHGAKNVSKREKYAFISDIFPDFPEENPRFIYFQAIEAVITDDKVTFLFYRVSITGRMTRESM